MGSSQRHDHSLRRVGPGHGKVFATDVRMRKGPPVTLALSLESNFRTRSEGVGTYLDAQALAEGGLRVLRLVQISDDHIVSRLRDHLQHTEDPRRRGACSWSCGANMRLTLSRSIGMKPP